MLVLYAIITRMAKKLVKSFDLLPAASAMVRRVSLR